MIDEIHAATGHSVRRICEVPGVPRSSCCAAAAAMVIAESGVSGQMQTLPALRRGSAAIMAERGHKALQPMTCLPRTSDGRADKPSPNLLEGRELPVRPDRVWAGDITHVPSATGWLYPAVVIDFCTRRKDGWSLARRLRAGLVSDAFKQALQTRRPGAGTVLHSDRGSQYGSGEYRALSGRAGTVRSMSARANPCHNAWKENAQGRDAPGRPFC